VLLVLKEKWGFKGKMVQQESQGLQVKQAKMGSLAKTVFLEVLETLGQKEFMDYKDRWVLLA
jgi:uncharacterized protein YmfQ (DUF2313 family)